MKRDTIKWRFFKYNIIIIFMLISFTAITFNVCVHLYLEKDVFLQLDKIASSFENTALKHGPDFFKTTPPPPPPNKKNSDSEKIYNPIPIDPQEDNYLLKYYFLLDHSLKNPLSLLNADFILLDENKNKITPFSDRSDFVSDNFIEQVINEINNSEKYPKEKHLNLHLSNNQYIAIIKPVFDKNSFGLGWIIIYSNIQKINHLKLIINIILFFILIFSALITTIFSSRVSQKISEPFFHLNDYISAISERNFSDKINMPVYDELRDLINNINIMSEKLNAYDKAQKTFFQNASHEFRTPLMSIQSYAEGIKYDVIDSNSAVEIILHEVDRIKNLVEDLLYLSRLESIEENYTYKNLDLIAILNNSIQRMNLFAKNNNVNLTYDFTKESIIIHCDEEKLSRAIDNIISNCIRYAKSSVFIKLETINNNAILSISDDGPGFKETDFKNIFERFYKGEKGNFGLGLSISKNIIEKLNGEINPKPSSSGALFIIKLPVFINCNL